MTDVKEIKAQFILVFKDTFSKVGNNMSVGIGKQDNNLTLEVRLSNDKLKFILPSVYRGLKVNVKIIDQITKQ